MVHFFSSVSLALTIHAYLLTLTATYHFKAWPCLNCQNSSSMYCFTVTLFCFLHSYDFDTILQLFLCYSLAFSSSLPYSFLLLPPQFLFIPFNSIGLKPCLFLSVNFQLCFFRFYFQLVLLLSLQFSIFA